MAFSRIMCKSKKNKWEFVFLNFYLCKQIVKSMNLPSDFIKSIESLLEDDADSFLSALADDAPVSIRLNPYKYNRNPMDFVDAVERVPWSDYGYYLADRPAFTFDPLFHAGYYYVQEASSMFVEYVVRNLIQEPVVCLDVCAAPGGKSVSLLSALPEGSLLVSNEIVRQRANVLAETIAKFGCGNTIVTNNAPKDFENFPHLFDLILVDAPCSGEGMFRKDEVAVQEWSPQNVGMCALRQKDILRDVWQSLKPGGLVIYSTCTYNTLENEENALWISRELGADFVSVPTKPEWNISPSAHHDVVAYRFFPHKINGEGLFVCVLKKKEGETVEASAQFQKKKPNKVSPFLKDDSEFAGLLKSSEKYLFIEENNHLFAIPKLHSQIMLALREQLKTIAVGIELGERKGKDFIPAQSLAMSNEFDYESFPQCKVDYEQAIAFLRKESIVLDNAPKGFVLLTYKNEPIGFVKNIGNRANNLYPQEWRIRSGYLPEKQQNLFR